MPTIRNDPGSAHHDDTLDSRRDGDESRLYISYANRLRRVLATLVHTSDANLQDACSFAWPGLRRLPLLLGSAIVLVVRRVPR